jgi:hypothetical protein
MLTLFLSLFPIAVVFDRSTGVLGGEMGPPSRKINIAKVGEG